MYVHVQKLNHKGIPASYSSLYPFLHIISKIILIHLLTLVLRNYPESVVLESFVKPSQWGQSDSI